MYKFFINFLMTVLVVLFAFFGVNVISGLDLSDAVADSVNAHSKVQVNVSDTAKQAFAGFGASQPMDQERLFQQYGTAKDYLRNWSLFLDFLILFKTIGVNINDKNAY
jgi:hypothetical protein